MTGRQERFAELDSYRGFAALAIIAFHLNYFVFHYNQGLGGVILSHLNLGVTFFFVLSGFVVFLPWANAAMLQGGLPSTRAFLGRRACRILPLYYFLLLLITGWQWVKGLDVTLGFIEHLTFTQNLDYRYRGSRLLIGPAWSLSLEVGFYLLLCFFGPLAYRICSEARDPRGRANCLIKMCLPLIAVSFAYRSVAYYLLHLPIQNGPITTPVYYSLIARWDTFVLGMVLACCAALRQGRPRLATRNSVLLGGGGFLLLIMGVALEPRHSLFRVHADSIAGVGFALILAATVLGVRGSLWCRILSWRPFQFLGTISYGVYLLHQPLLLEFQRLNLLPSAGVGAFISDLLALTLLVCALATATYFTIERPFLRRAKLRRERSPNLVRQLA